MAENNPLEQIADILQALENLRDWVNGCNNESERLREIIAEMRVNILQDLGWKRYEAIDFVRKMGFNAKIDSETTPIPRRELGDLLPGTVFTFSGDEHVLLAKPHGMCIVYQRASSGRVTVLPSRIEPDEIVWEPELEPAR